MIIASWNILRGLRAWRAANYGKCVTLLCAEVAKRDLARRPVSPHVWLKLLMASALTKNSDVAQSQLKAIEFAILGNDKLSDHDKNYLFLVVEVACHRLQLSVPSQAAKASRTRYRASNHLIETYPIGLLLPEHPEGEV